MDAPDPTKLEAEASTAPAPAPAPARPRHTPTHFAFLVHSQESVTNKRPPAVDNKHLARQRRRRTSPEDQAILEYEFARDSKPDKVSRARIAARVALGEKEVQIWFQNRRSTARRRSGPWIPPDYLPRSSDPPNDDPYPPPPLPPASATQQDQGQPSVHAAPDEASAEFNREWSAFVRGANSVAALGRSDAGQAAPQAPPMSSVSQEDRTQADEAQTQGEGQHNITTTLTRSSSGVRLSMTSDGGARILRLDESTPSPPRPSQSSASSSSLSSSTRGLRRSYSAAGFTDSFAYSQGSAGSSRGSSGRVSTRTRRLPAGRSRDSRAWEFWCDADARNDLAKHAEQDQKGSAAAAISLIRSNSSDGRRGGRRPALTQNATKANRIQRSGGRAASSPKRVLKRTSTATGRLQSRKDSGIHILEDEPPAKSRTAAFSPHAPGNPDSDKENLDPDSCRLSKNQHDNPAKDLPARNDGTQKPLHELRAFHRKCEDVEERRVTDPEQDEELADFMRAPASTEPSDDGESGGGDDLDCVRGLLSLSRGS